MDRNFIFNIEDLGKGGAENNGGSAAGRKYLRSLSRKLVVGQPATPNTTVL
jgi:hypothetical protein